MAQLTRFERWWLDSWPHRWRVRRRVPAFLRSSPEPFRGEVLEVGAGSGWTSQTILETFPQVELTATDIDLSSVHKFERLQGRYGRRLKVQQADILDLPFDRAAFDIVIAMHVLHHVDDVPRALSQLVRVLRPGGLLGIADQDQRFVFGPVRWLWRPTHRLSRDELVELIQQEMSTEQVAGEVYWHCWARKAYPYEADRATVSGS